MRSADVLGALLESPLYFAVMVWFPNVKDDVLKLALPTARGTVPSTVMSSKNVTVPVGLEPATVAVKVTSLPMTDGFSDDTTVVVVGAVASSVMRHSSVPVTPSLARR